MPKVLLTGGSGFIAAHILEQLLEQGHHVVTTVRSEAKAQKIRDAHKDVAERLQVVIVPDIAQPHAFDGVANTPGLQIVLHTASPFHYNVKDPQVDLIEPAVIGTTGILKALAKSAPSVTRVVITSSFAAILDAASFTDPNTTFSETSWNPVTIDEIHESPAIAYRVSKTLAEKAAWDFVAQQKPAFDLVTVNPPLVLGPVVHHLATLDSINTSNSRVVALLKGQWKDAVPSTLPVPIWVDVRDVAKAHIRAFEEPSAGGQRLFTTAGWFSNREIVDVVRSKFPEFSDRLPAPDVKGGELPSPDQVFKVNNDATNKLLKIKWIGLEESITDLVTSLKEHGI